MTPELLAELRTPHGEAVLSRAADLTGREPLAAGQALRAAGVPGPLAAAALTQAELRVRARAKFGPDADRMFFTRPGLEQATRSVVARRRAARLVEAGVRSLVDLGAGVGSDALAAAAAGIRVLAVERDPLTAAVAAANAEALGVGGLMSVRCADATGVDLDGTDAVFCDPARRRADTRVFDPAAYSPPWEFVTGLAARVPATVLKLAPGIDHGLVPPGAEAEWVSVDGDVVEAAFWCGPLARVPRRASVLPVDAQLTGSGERQAPVGPVRGYLYEPDGAVIRAHLVAECAEALDGTLADASIAYVFADAPSDTPYARGYQVLEELPYGLKLLRAALRERGVGRLTIKKRGLAIDPDQLRRQLRLAGPDAATLLLTRVAQRPRALLVRPLAGRCS